MKPNYLHLILLAFLTLFSSTVYAKSSVWKIAKGDAYFYLGGTVHLLSASDHPLPEVFELAYQDSDKLIFETNISEMKTPESQQKVLQTMLSHSGRTLIDELKPQTFSDLKRFLADRQIPVDNFLQFQPWAVALTMTVLEYQRIGLVPEYGVEEYFNRKASLDKKQVGQLEDIDAQLSFLASMAKVEPNVMIDYTLRDLTRLPKYAEFLKSRWRTGDIEAFNKDNLMVQMKSEFPDLYTTFVTNRNNNWMKDLVKLNDNALIEFVLVGALHLYGEEGLLHQLKHAGFNITQLEK